MSTTVIVIVCLSIAYAAWCARHGVPLPNQFKSSTCQGAAWRRTYPGASKQDIRRFLGIFAEAFEFHQTHRLKFHPNDALLSIYRALYPHEWQPDGLELEMLDKYIGKQYGLKLTDVWNEHLTLGQLFAATRC